MRCEDDAIEVGVQFCLTHVLLFCYFDFLSCL
jgi:hypothetical protein